MPASRKSAPKKAAKTKPAKKKPARKSARPALVRSRRLQTRRAADVAIVLETTPVPTGIASPNNAIVIRDEEGEAHGLGHVATFDQGDFGFPMSHHLGEIDGDPMTQTQVHALGPIMNQHSTQSCVGHGWTLFLTSAPRLTRPGPEPFRIYHEAQQMDDTPGEEPTYYGTSVRAGAKAMQKDGWIKGDYVWAEDVRVLWKFVLSRGPVVLGASWYEGMNKVDSDGFVNLTGGRLGGHCFLCYGVDAEEPGNRAFLCANSWGKGWGQAGTFRLRYEDVRQLFFRQALVGCSALEKV